MWLLSPHQSSAIGSTKSVPQSPCGELSLDFFVRDAFATVELIQPFLDCRKKLDPVGDFLQGNAIGQLANCIQDNFFLTHANEYVRPLPYEQIGRSAVILTRQFLARSVVD